MNEVIRIRRDRVEQLLDRIEELEDTVAILENRLNPEPTITHDRLVGDLGLS